MRLKKEVSVFATMLEHFGNDENSDPKVLKNSSLSALAVASNVPGSRRQRYYGDLLF